MSNDDWREERLRARRQREAEEAAAEAAALAALMTPPPPKTPTAQPMAAARPAASRFRMPSPNFGRTRTQPAGPGLTAFGLTLPPLNLLQISLVALGLVLVISVVVVRLKSHHRADASSQSSAVQQAAVVQAGIADDAGTGAPASALRPALPVSTAPIATTGLDGEAGAASGSGDAPVITTPARWIEKPGDDDIAAAFPDEAKETSGRAVVQCAISAQGEPSNCSVQSETPTGSGFGQAALGLARKFKFKPKTLNGVAVDGGVATIPVHFAR